MKMWKWKSLSLCGSVTVQGILQARILEWVAFFFSRESSQPKDQTQVSRIAGGFSTSWATGKPKLPLWSCFLAQQQNNPVKNYNRSQVSCAQNLQLLPYFSHLSNIAYVALNDLQLNLLSATCSSWPPTVPWTHLRMLASFISSALYLDSLMASSLPLSQFYLHTVFSLSPTLYQGFPGGSGSKESACNAEDPSLMTESWKSPGVEISLQYSCLENSMDRGAWCATAHRVAKSQTWLSD